MEVEKRKDKQTNNTREMKHKQQINNNNNNNNYRYCWGDARARTAAGEEKRSFPFLLYSIFRSNAPHTGAEAADAAVRLRNTACTAQLYKEGMNDGRAVAIETNTTAPHPSADQ